MQHIFSYGLHKIKNNTPHMLKCTMASELRVPGNFSPLKLMRVFADFHEDHKRGLEPLHRLQESPNG